MDRVELHDVEYGDCTVLVGQNQQILMVDCGSVSRYARRGEEEIDRRFNEIFSRYTPAAQRQFLLTHYHRDHMSGFLKQVKRDPGYFDRVYLPALPCDKRGVNPVLEFAVFAHFFAVPQSDFAQVNTTCLRIFDALNDPRNLETAIKAAIKEKAHVQGCISYTLSPVHNNEYFAKYAKTLEEMGAHSICIKDMAGLLTPYSTYELVKSLKETVSIPVDIHSHYTSGLASMYILKGIEAGADIIDTAISPLSLGTSHMPTESLVAALQGTDYDTGLDLKKLNVVREHFAKLREKYLASGQLSPKMLGVDANTLLYQVPGGMLSNLLKQLKDAGKEDQLDAVLQEIPRVRKDSGYPPLVTPTSQIVGTQAVFNVILGERYKMVTKEFKGLVHGDYGKTPAPISPEFTKQILGDEQPITCRPADLLEPEIEKLKAEASKYVMQEEDVLTYAMFPQVAPKFFEKRNNKLAGVDGDHVDFEGKSHPV